MIPIGKWTYKDVCGNEWEEIPHAASSIGVVAWETTDPDRYLECEILKPKISYDEEMISFHTTDDIPLDALFAVTRRALEVLEADERYGPKYVKWLREKLSI